MLKSYKELTVWQRNPFRSSGKDRGGWKNAQSLDKVPGKQMRKAL